MGMNPRRAWRRFVDASFTAHPDAVYNPSASRSPLGWAEFRARFRRSAPTQPVEEVEPAPYLYNDMEEPLRLPVPLGSLDFPRAWHGRRHGDRLPKMDILDGEGNVRETVEVNPSLARPYVESPTTYIERPRVD